MKRTRRPCWQAQTASAIARCVLPVPRVADQHDRIAVVDPRALGERRDRRLRHAGVISEPELLQALEQREPRVQQPPAFAAFGAFVHLGLEQRREVRDRGLLLAGRLRGHLPEPGLDGRELQLGRVRLDQRLQRRGLQRSCGRSSLGPPGRE